MMGSEEYIRYSLLSSRLANYRTAKSQLCLSRERRDKNGTPAHEGRSSKYAPGPCCPRIERQYSFTINPALSDAVKPFRVASLHSRARSGLSLSIEPMSPGISIAIRWRA